MVLAAIDYNDMEHLELLEQIVTHLNKLDDEALEDLLSELERDITDENLDVITYGADDTEHLLSSSRNAAILHQAMNELQGQELR